MKNIFSRATTVQKYFNSNVPGPRDGLESVSPVKSLEVTHEELLAAAKRINEIRLNVSATDADIQELKQLEAKYNAAGKTTEQMIAQAKVQAEEKHQALNVAVDNAPLATPEEKQSVIQSRDAGEQKLVEQVGVAKAEVAAQTNQNARTTLSETISRNGVSHQQFKQWVAEWQRTGDNNVGFKVVQAMFSDFNGKYMPNFMVFSDDKGNMVEKTNSYRLIGKGGQRQQVGELQMFNIIENHKALFSNFLVRNGVTENSSINEILAHRETLFKKLDALSDVQQMITGSISNVSVDIPTVLAGNEQVYIDQLLAKRENLLKIKDQMIDETDPNGFWSRLGAKVKELGVVLPLPGVYLRAESHELKFTELTENTEAGKALADQVKSRGLQAVLGDGPVNITGKISLLAAIGQLNFNDDVNKIVNEVNNYSKDLQSMNRETFLASVGEKYPELANSQLIQTFKQNSNIPYSSLVNVLVHNKLGELTTGDQGWRLKGVEGLIGLTGVGVGASAQRIGSKFYETDGRVRQAVTEGIAQSADGLITVSKNPDNTLSYTFTNTPSLQAQIRQIDSSAKISIEGDKLKVVTSNLLNTTANVDVLANGDEKISYNIENAGNAVTITAGVPDSVEQYILSEAVEGRAMAAVEASGFERLDGRSNFAKEVYHKSRYHKDFATIILPAIANGDYATAYAKMQYHTKSLAEVRNFVTVNGQPNQQKMLELLTYTYGSSSKELNGRVRASTYEADRRKVLRVEQNVIKDKLGVDITIDETPFLNKVHTSTSAAKMFPGQHIAMSIVASPANSKQVSWNPTRRLDNFDAALAISNHTASVNNDALKVALLEKAHSARVDKEVNSINTQLGLEPKITRAQYIDMMTGKVTPDSVHKGLKFQAGKEPKFFEARAMVEGNICNNLSYGIAFPLFEIPGRDRVMGERKVEGKPGETIVQNPVVVATLNAGDLGEKVQVTEVGVGVGPRPTTSTPDPMNTRTGTATGNEALTNTGAGVTNSGSNGVSIGNGNSIDLIP